jgi:hypothetical protein
MLRPAIVANIKQRPQSEHILHINDLTAPIFSDIEGLTIVSLEGKTDKLRARRSQEKISEYGMHNLYELSRPCAKYEVENVPYIVKSRQRLFCEVIGVDFSYFNYDVGFTDEELDFAEYFLSDKYQCVGVHLRSAEAWRDFRYVNIMKDKLRMWNIVEGLAKKIDGYVVTFDASEEYTGRLKNIVSLVEPDIRKVWVVMSKMVFGVGPDSAGVHLFGSAGVPVYGIFGPTDPGIRLQYHDAYWSPRYKKCGKQFCWYWYVRCKHNIGCLNGRTSAFYVKDIMRKMGRFLR